MGVRGTCLKWFNSYLENRTQYTKINNIISSSAAVCSGVPQGSVLGPILYLLYVNDDGCNEVSSQILMFTDDTALINTGSNPELVTASLEQDLNVVNNYFTSLRLKLNVTKTRIVHFGKGWKKQPVIKQSDIRIDGKVVGVMNEFKYLGVLIDNTLKFTRQKEANIKKGNHKLYLFRKIRSCLDSNSALILYKSLIMPYLEFCNVLLLGCNEREKIKGCRISG